MSEILNNIVVEVEPYLTRGTCIKCGGEYQYRREFLDNNLIQFRFSCVDGCGVQDEFLTMSE
jgi:hypothetical protein